MEKKYSIRKYKPGDERGIVELLCLVFNGWPHFDLECDPLEHWRWKYEDNPLKNSVIPIAENDGLIVGLNHGYSMDIKIGNKILSCSQGTDLAVHPEYQRMGIYKKMSEFKTEIYMENKTNLTWAVTGNPIVYKTNIEWGRSTFPHIISSYMMIQDVELHFRIKKIKSQTFKKYGIQLLKFINKFIYAGRKSYDKTKNIRDKIYNITNFNGKIDTFWDEIKQYYNFIIVRNQDYLNWRYFDPRGGKYIVKICEAEGKILGYIVLRINLYNPEYPEGYIVDMLTIPNRLDVANNLIKNSINFFKDNKINVIYCLAIKKHPYETLLKKNGFIDSRNRASFIIQLLNVGGEWNDFISAPAHRMHFQYGDTDWI